MFLKNLYRLLYLFLFVCCSAILYSQELKFVNYTIKEGLTDDGVVKVVQDKRGFVWIATYNGLSRFDGKHFKNYNAIPGDTNSLRSIWVTDLLLDNQGTLWISTEWGVCYYNEKFDNFHYINRQNDVITLYRSPMCLSSDGSIWVAAENGLLKIDPQKKSYTKTSLQRIADPQSIIFDGHQTIWIGTRGFGLLKYNISSATHQKIASAHFDEFTHTMNFYKDEEGIWAATSAGLVQIDHQQRFHVYNKSTAGLNNTLVSNLMCVSNFQPLTADSMLLCGSYDKQLLLFNKRSKKFVHRWQNKSRSLNNVPDGVFFCLTPASQVFWIGTDHGLSKLNVQRQDYATTLIPQLADSTGSNILVKHVVQDATNKNFLWLVAGTANAALMLYDVAKEKVVRQFIAGKDYAGYTTAIQDKNGIVWALRTNAIDAFHVQKGLIKSYKTSILPQSVTLDHQSNLWIGTDRGIAFFNTRHNQLVEYINRFSGTAIENNSFGGPFPVSSLKYDGKETVWMASYKFGLFSFSTRTKEFTAYRQPFNTAYDTRNKCTDVVIDKTGKLWVSSMNGLSEFDTAKRAFINYSINNGLASTYVYSLLLDENGNIWGRGNTGVFTYDIAGKKFKNYKLPSRLNGFYYLQHLAEVNKRPTLGFEGGIVTFNQSNNKTEIPANIVLTSCTVLNKPFFFQPDSIHQNPPTLNYNENIISFEFTSIHHDDPELLNYSYKLEGFNPTWVESGSKQTATYTNLPPGDYSFMVKARIADGSWSEPVKGFVFTIKPALWQRVWFWPVVVLLFIGAVAIIAYKRIKMIRKTEQEKTATAKTIAETELKALRSQMNPHFIFNSLNSIQKYIWENKQEDASEYLTKFARLVRLVLENSESKLVSLHDEITALKLYVELEHRRSNHKFDYAISIDDKLDTLCVQIPPLLLQPYIENSIWHGLNTKDDRGELIISIQKQGEQLVCTIDDNGIGREASAEKRKGIQHRSFGLNISKQRVEMMEKETGCSSTVTIIDKKENNTALGTTVIITLPIILANA